MSVANILPAVALLGGFVVLGSSVAMRAVLPSPPPIEIRSLSYDHGMVTLEQTVRGEDDVVLLGWAAQLVEHETGNAVPGCTGSGVWPFETGQRSSVVTLDQWVGTIACLPGILPEGVYHLRMTYSWGDDIVTASSEEFEVSR